MHQASPVVVVSGVGPGTGAAIARRFAHGGYAAAMLARSAERLAQLAFEIPGTHAYPCDVTDEGQLDATFTAIRTELGVPKVLVHNAVGGAFGNFMEIDPQVLNHNFQVNTMALLSFARRLAPAMIEAGEGAMMIVAFLGLPLTPLILTLSLPPSEAGLQIDTLKILQTLLTAQLIPLSVGMTIQRVRPTWAEKLLRFVPKLGRIGVLLTLTLITATQAQQIVGLGILPHLTALISILVCLLIGDVMMRGEAAEVRRSLAISTAIRNVALAFLIVGTNFPGTPAVTIAFVFGLYSLIVGFAYGKLMSGADVQNAEA